MIEVRSGRSKSSGKSVTTSMRTWSANLFGIVGGDHHDAALDIDPKDGAPERGDEALTPLTHDAIHLVAARAENLDELADLGSISGLHAQADEVAPVVGARFELVGGSLEIAPDKRLRSLARIDAVEVKHGDPAADLHAPDPQWLGVALRPQLGTGLEPL